MKSDIQPNIGKISPVSAQMWQAESLQERQVLIQTFYSKLL